MRARRVLRVVEEEEHSAVEWKHCTGGFHLSDAAGTKLEAPAELRSLRSLRSLEVVSQQSYSETSECEAVSLKTRPIKNVFLVFLPCSSEDRGYVILK